MRLKRPLTVKKLKKLLEKLPDDMEVCIGTWNDLEWDAIRPFGTERRKKTNRLMIHVALDESKDRVGDSWDA